MLLLKFQLPLKRTILGNCTIFFFQNFVVFDSSATRLFERGTAQHRMELLARALVLLSKCSIIEQQTLNCKKKPKKNF